MLINHRQKGRPRALIGFLGLLGLIVFHGCLIASSLAFSLTAGVYAKTTVFSLQAGTRPDCGEEAMGSSHVCWVAVDEAAR